MSQKQVWFHYLISLLNNIVVHIFIIINPNAVQCPLCSFSVQCHTCNNIMSLSTISMESVLVIVMSTLWWIMMPHKLKPKCQICVVSVFVTLQVWPMWNITLTKWQRMRRCKSANTHQMKRISSHHWSPESHKVQGSWIGTLPVSQTRWIYWNSFPYIKKLSLKLNTGLPASAACKAS